MLSKIFIRIETPKTHTRNNCFFFVIKIHCKIFVAKKIGRDKERKRSGKTDGEKSCFTNPIRGERYQTNGTRKSPNKKKTVVYRSTFFISIREFFSRITKIGYKLFDKNRGSAIRKSKNLYAKS